MKKRISLASLVGLALLVPSIAVAGFNLVQNPDGSTAFEGAGSNATEVLNIDPDGNVEMNVPISWVNLGNSFLDGSKPIDNTTTPNWATTGNISGITWDNSSETNKVQFSGRYPEVCGGGLVLDLLFRSGGADSPATNQAIDWQIWIEGDGVAFDATAVDQTGASFTNTSLNTSSELVTLTLDATGQAAISKGSQLTIDVWNAGTSSNSLILTHADARCGTPL